MIDDSPYKISQGYDVIPPSTGKAYPILCDEWEFLKGKVREVSGYDNPYHSLGFLLLGASLSTILAVLTGAIPSGKEGEWPITLVIAIACIVVLAITGAVTLHFSNQQNKIKKTLASDILSQMEIIEKRYNLPDVDDEMCNS